MPPRGSSRCSTITSMSDIICVTNRKLCSGDFLKRIEEIAACRPGAIILREKDLSEDEYERLAEKVMRICSGEGVFCILHSFAAAAKKTGAKGLHLPLSMLLRAEKSELLPFEAVGASCHSAEEAAAAQARGCTYVTAGHVFETDCKAGLAPRGTEFLENVCKSVKIPVLAIGGINRENAWKARRAGAAGLCVMSGLMKCENVEKYFTDMEKGREMK